MSKPKTPPAQYQKTKELISEIYKLSKRESWGDLFDEIERGSPGIVTGVARLRQLGNGLRFLSDNSLYELATWAKSKKWNGPQIRAALKYVPLTTKEIDEEEQYKKHMIYVNSLDPQKQIDDFQKIARHVKTEFLNTLKSALAQASPAGFSHADVMYMVHSWLNQNPETSQRGKRQRSVAGWNLSLGSGFQMPVEPSSLPRNFVMPEHINDERMFFIYTFHTSERKVKEVIPVVNKKSKLRQNKSDLPKVKSTSETSPNTKSGKPSSKRSSK